MTTVYFASDHAGYEAKERLIPFVASLGYETEDCGAVNYDETDDYPDFVSACARNVADHAGSFGIVLGASGEGEAMAANRVPGIRAAVYYGDSATLQTDAGGATHTLLESSRAHNDANILSLGARFLTGEEMEQAVRLFLATPFSGDARHKRRIQKLA